MQRMVRKPWGFYITLAQRPTWWLKFLFVWGKTSLQKHSHRSEFHVGTRGIKIVKPEEYHRLSWGLYIEYAWGNPAEADIVRIQDDYGRV